MTRIVAIDIAADAPTQQRMIQTCIEFHFVGLALTFDCQTTQMLIPATLSLAVHTVEALTCSLSLAVETGIGNGGVADAYLHGHLPRVCSRKRVGKVR